MGNEGADANHFRMKTFNKADIFYQVFYSLKRAAHHDTCSCLITDSFQLVEAFDTPLVGHFVRVQTIVMSPVDCFVT